ncbi:lamin tail domain-containing protein [Streptomyces massasporeus]|uniref:lamin tail domain-containing protein n=1 Tax=Streptomyces massasporeus TaxID=67324 RepID=UPI0037134AAF
MNLDNWTLQDEDGSWTLQDEDGHTLTFHHYRPDARSTLPIHTGEDHDSHSNLSQHRHNHVWDNHSDTTTLRNDHGRLINDAPRGHHRHGDRSGHHHR